MVLDVAADTLQPPKRSFTTTIRGMFGGWATRLAMGIIVLVVGAVILAPLISPDNPLTQNIGSVLSKPSSAHWLGTDTLGRDVLSRLLYGGRTTLLAVTLALAVYLVIGVVAGLVAGYASGWADQVVSFVVNVLMSIPGIVVVLSVAAILKDNEFAIMTALGVILSVSLIRVVRAETRAVRSSLYVEAATIAGIGRLRVLFLQILPQLAGPVIVQCTVFCAAALGVEGSLGFLGVGVPPPAPTWGNMLGEAFTVISSDPWLTVPTAAIIAVMTLCLAHLGDTLRGRLAERTSADAPTRAPAPAQELPEGPATKREQREGTPSLVVRDLCVRASAGRGEPLVDHVTFDLNQGECLGLVGESGSGKTLTALAVLGLLPPSLGASAESIELAGAEVFGLTDRQMGAYRGSTVGMISQEPMLALDPMFTVGSQLVEVIRAHRPVSKAGARAIAENLLATVHLREPEAVLKKHPHELSGGMAQRVAIAIALAGEPQVLIADEPTTALDVSVQAGILDLLRELGSKRGLAILMITHDLAVVADICERAIVMKKGRMVEEADVRGLFARPRHPYTRALLAATPSLVDA